MAAGLLQYCFFPTDFFYPRPPQPEKVILSLETPKREDYEDGDDGMIKKPTKLHQTKASQISTSTPLTVVSPGRVIADQVRSRRLNHHINHWGY